MAQLYDCFQKSGLAPLHQIYQSISRLTPLMRGEENILLSDILAGNYQGRVFANDIIASVNLPHFANSAVDGYAFAHADLKTETRLKITAYIEAGSREKYWLDSGEAAIIFTGAVMPKNADTVLMCEDAAEDITMLIQKFLDEFSHGKDKNSGKAVFVTIPQAIRKYDNYRPAGDDVEAGDKIILKGSMLHPPAIALCAALGLKHIPLLPKLKIALFSTGDELVTPEDSSGNQLEHGKIYDANRPLLFGLLAHLGVEVHDYGIIADNKNALRAACDEAAAHHDLILTSGAMSEGGKDYIRHLLEQEGRLHFLRAAIKPGRPVGIGDWQGVPLIGLPGNPVAAFTVFLVIALPMIQMLRGCGMREPKLFPAIVDFNFKKRPNRIEYVRVTVKNYDKKSGLPILSSYGKRGAGIISSLVGADGFAVFDEDTISINSGMQVSYLPFDQFF